jgi:hypothetical protein
MTGQRCQTFLGETYQNGEKYTITTKYAKWIKN